MVTPVVLLLAASLSQSLDSRAAKWKPVRMAFDATALNARERRTVRKLVDAAKYMESIYWRQADPEGLTLLRTTRDATLRRLLTIHGGRFDLLDDNHPFAAGARFAAGRALYPAGLTRGEIEAYVRLHPEEKDAIYSPYTVIRRDGERLKAVPYREEYARFLQPAARLLNEAAALAPDRQFAAFLRLRAEALLDDDYYPSDMAWVDLREPRIDVIFAPYETYLDGVLGVKTSYEAAVLLRNEAESRKLALYEKYVPEIQDALPLAKEDLPSKRGQPTPMEVVDAPFRAGDLRHGYQAVADNLPNDPRIHATKGTKKIFFKNFMDARVRDVILPLAREAMRPDQAAKVSAEGYLAAVILHEICHGLGPDFARVHGKKQSIRESVGPIFGALEEAKADVTGMYALDWLMERGALPKSRAGEYYASYVAGIFRTVRYGIAEAHGRAEMMEFNYLAGEGAVTMSKGRYDVDAGRMRKALGGLARELLEIEAAGDRARAERWFARYDKMPPKLAKALSAARDVPVDIDPVFDFAGDFR